MAKGYNANKERQEAIAVFGKALAKRAGFSCEWCEGKENLRPWDYRPEAEPVEENLALLCGHCRELAEGKPARENELYALRNALWSSVPAVAEGAARVIARCKEPWAREAIEESLIDEAVKQGLLGQR
jgi:hypothetical protein